jgi:hypothetical protein
VAGQRLRPSANCRESQASERNTLQADFSDGKRVCLPISLYSGSHETLALISTTISSLARRSDKNLRIVHDRYPSSSAAGVVGQLPNSVMSFERFKHSVMQFSAALVDSSAASIPFGTYTKAMRTVELHSTTGFIATTRISGSATVVPTFERYVLGALRVRIS